MIDTLEPTPWIVDGETKERMCNPSITGYSKTLLIPYGTYDLNGT